MLRLRTEQKGRKYSKKWHDKDRKGQIYARNGQGDVKKTQVWPLSTSDSFSKLKSNCFQNIGVSAKDNYRSERPNPEPMRELRYGVKRDNTSLLCTELGIGKVKLHFSPSN